MRLRYTAIVWCLAAGCATATKGDVDALKPTLEFIHGEMKWKNFRTVAKQVVPEKREAFTAACDKRDDEKNLFVTEYELEDCAVNASDQTLAVCMSRVSYYRLPSATAKSVKVATTLKWQGGQWLIDRQSDGPFAEELSLETKIEPKPEPKP